MRNVSRPAILITAALAAATLATPAFASSPTTTDAHTSLNARASKAVVAPRHTDTVSLMLRSHHAGVAGQADHFVVRMRHDSTNAKWSTWSTVAATPGVKDGRYTVSVTMPGKIAKGKKEQFQVKFTGDAAHHLAASRSQVFTVAAG